MTSTGDLRERVPVSVVIPCYRCDDTLVRAIASVMGQTVLPVEIIAVEDCSNDGGRTLSALEVQRAQHGDVVDIRIVSLPDNRGAGEARNAGWAAATQEFIAFLDADDAWHPQKLAIQAAWMRANPEYVLTSHETREQKGIVADKCVELPVTHTAIRPLPMLFRNEIGTRTVMLRRSILHRFLPGMRYAEDYNLWLRILFDRGRAAKLNAPLAYSYKRGYGEGGLSANLPEMHRGALRCFRDLYADGLIPRGHYMAASLYEYVKYWKRISVTVSTRMLRKLRRHI